MYVLHRDSKVLCASRQCSVAATPRVARESRPASSRAGLRSTVGAAESCSYIQVAHCTSSTVLIPSD
jgi:hypothetical protein